MTNFDKQLKAAIETYAQIDGRSSKEIFSACQNNPNGKTAENIKLLMFAAR